MGKKSALVFLNYLVNSEKKKPRADFFPTTISEKQHFFRHNSYYSFSFYHENYCISKIVHCLRLLCLFKKQCWLKGEKEFCNNFLINSEKRQFFFIM